MDDAVIRAMARWPNVPAVFGWLGLDRRGRWLLRDEPLTHQGVVEFIGRNYAADERGRWYFQNGPQRVFVALAAAPYVFALDTGQRLLAHTGADAGLPIAAWVADSGHVFVRTPVGPGVLDDRDLDVLSDGLSLDPDPASAGSEADAVEALLGQPERLDQVPLWLHHHPSNASSPWSVRLGYLAFEAAADELGFERNPADDATPAA